MGERGKDPKEKTCAICGKEIYAGEEWAYKRRIHGERTLWFCSYKCMRTYDAKTEGPKKPRTETEAPPAPPKEPTSRADQAKALAREILAGRSVIAWLKKEGYKNPHEAYSAVRHYAQTKMPELAETLKPLKDLPKAPQAARTGRPRKYPAKVETVEKVPEIERECGTCKNAGKTLHEPPCDTCAAPDSCEMRAWEPKEDPEPVQCIAHVTDAEIEEVMRNMRQRHDNLIVPGAQEAEEQKEPEKPKVDPKIAMEELSKALSDFGNNIFTKERVLRILDEAALDCQKDLRIITMSSSGVKAAMLQNATVAAENVGIMKLRSRIRKILGAEDDG